MLVEIADFGLLCLKRTNTETTPLTIVNTKDKLPFDACSANFVSWFLCVYPFLDFNNAILLYTPVFCDRIINRRFVLTVFVFYVGQRVSLLLDHCSHCMLYQPST